MQAKISEKLFVLEAKRRARWGTGKGVGWTLGEGLVVGFDPSRIQTI